MPHKYYVKSTCQEKKKTMLNQPDLALFLWLFFIKVFPLVLVRYIHLIRWFYI